uniref:Secreted protein n=1 Tax=Romanomermis culicivorax TaxID=13658 RepID=A0A915JTD0_ROMCU
MICASIAASWIGADSSIGTRARVEISSSISFKKFVICVAVTARSNGAAGVGRADTSADGSSFAIFKSKIGVSKSSSSAGSTLTPKVGHCSSLLAVSVCTEAVVGKGYAYTGTGNENRF